MGSQQSHQSQDEDLKELPQYTVEHETKSKVKVIHSVREKQAGETDTKNLSSLLSTLIECRLTLGGHLRVWPYLWNELAKTLAKMGIKGIHHEKIEDMKWINRTPIDVQIVPLNKVGDYCEGEDGNITLPIEYNYVNALTILDSGAGIVIATKSIWEACGKN